MKQFKILVPKAGSNDEHGLSQKLYVLDEIVEAKDSWQEELMNSFVQNGWAMEVKVDSSMEEGEAVRARDDKGHYVADDPSTPDVNEAYVGGKAPAKKTTKKKTTKKKS
jgi:hypothetical protein